MSQHRERGLLRRALGAAVRFPGRKVENNRFVPQMMNLLREALNDLRATFASVMWGQQENPPTMGSPMSPTPQAIDQRLKGTDMQRNVPQRSVAPPMQKQGSILARLRQAISRPQPQVQAQARQQVQMRHRGIER